MKLGILIFVVVVVIFTLFFYLLYAINRKETLSENEDTYKERKLEVP